jgi:hypothetical protein
MPTYPVAQTFCYHQRCAVAVDGQSKSAQAQTRLRKVMLYGVLSYLEWSVGLFNLKQANALVLQQYSPLITGALAGTGVDVFQNAIRLKK